MAGSAIGIGLNLKSVRELNKMKLFTNGSFASKLDNTGDATLFKGSSRSKKWDEEMTEGDDAVKCIFSAYTRGGFSFQTSIQANPFTTGQFFQGGGVISQLGKALMQTAGYVPQFDVPKLYDYMGSSPIPFNVNCFLKLETDPQTDFVKPLNNLFKCFLPSRGESVVTAADNLARATVGDTVTSAVESGISTFWDCICSWCPAIAEYGDKLFDYVKDSNVLKIPFPYSITDGKSNKLTVRIGRFRIDEVAVKGITFDTPLFLYEEGWPDHIQLTINFETMRIATSDMVSQFFNV